MKAKGVGNKPAPYLLVFTLFLGAVICLQYFAQGIFADRKAVNLWQKAKAV